MTTPLCHCLDPPHRDTTPADPAEVDLAHPAEVDLAHPTEVDLVGRADPAAADLAEVHPAADPAARQAEVDPAEADLAHPTEVDLVDPADPAGPAGLAHPAEVDLVGRAARQAADPAEVYPVDPAEVDLAHPTEVDLVGRADPAAADLAEADLAEADPAAARQAEVDPAEADSAVGPAAEADSEAADSAEAEGAAPAEAEGAAEAAADATVSARGRTDNRRPQRRQPPSLAKRGLPSSNYSPPPRHSSSGVIGWVCAAESVRPDRPRRGEHVAPSRRHHRKRVRRPEYS